MSFLAPEFIRSRNGKAVMNKPNISTTQNNLYQVLTAEELLKHPKRQILLKKIKRESGIEEPHFSALYHSLIERFVEFVQALPAQTGGKLGGLMDDGLERALLAVHFTSVNPDPLRKYAFFSAALLVDVGRALGLQKVMISDVQGAFVVDWDPLKGSLLEQQAEFYKIRPLGDQWTTLSQIVTPYIARQLLPGEAFQWLSEDYAVFQMWLATLLRDATHGGELADFLFEITERRHVLEQKREFKDYPATQELPAVDVPTTQPEETAAAEEFLAFLNNGVENGTISPADVQLLNSGELFVDAKVLQRFMDLYSSKIPMTVLVKQLNYLGLHKLSGDDVRFEQFFSQIPDRVAKPALPFFNMNNPPTHGLPGAVSAGTKEGLRLQRPELYIRNMMALAKSQFHAPPPPPKQPPVSQPTPPQGQGGLWSGKK